MRKRCERCGIVERRVDMGCVDLDVNRRLWAKGYVCKKYFLCENCLKQLYDFLGLDYYIDNRIILR